MNMRVKVIPSVYILVTTVLREWFVHHDEQNSIDYCSQTLQSEKFYCQASIVVQTSVVLSLLVHSPVRSLYILFLDLLCSLSSSPNTHASLELGSTNCPSRAGTIDQLFSLLTFLAVKIIISRLIIVPNSKFTAQIT